MWKKISLLENLLKESIIQTNLTQKNLQDEFQQIVKDQTDNDSKLTIMPFYKQNQKYLNSIGTIVLFNISSFHNFH